MAICYLLSAIRHSLVRSLTWRDIHLIVQIYAITSVAEALTLAGLGVDHVGFVAGNYGQVYGELSFDQARLLPWPFPESLLLRSHDEH